MHLLASQLMYSIGLRIFQLENRKLKEIRERSNSKRSFDYEKTLQKMIENNLSIIFPNVELLKTEHQIGDLRPDTIAFDVEKKSFVIIEYKNIAKANSLTDQGFSYYQLLKDKKESFVLLYNKITKRHYDLDYFNWDETRVVFISPEFTKFQKKAGGFEGLPIVLYRINRYENDIITMAFAGGQKETISENHKKRNKMLALTTYVEDDYLAGKYHNARPSDMTKKLWNELKNRILDMIPELEFTQKKIYAGFYSREHGSCICTMEAMQSKIALTYSVSDKNILPLSKFIIDVSDKGHHGVGNFQSDIKTDKDIQNALPLIKKTYEFKINRKRY